MADLTPLSIAHASPRSKSAAKDKQEAYEEKVKRRAFKQDDDLPKFIFGSAYRDTLVDKDFEAEETAIYPTIPLPPVPKAPNLRPQRDVRILPPLDPAAILAKVSSLKAGM